MTDRERLTQMLDEWGVGYIDGVQEIEHVDGSISTAYAPGWITIQGDDGGPAVSGDCEATFRFDEHGNFAHLGLWEIDE